MEIWIVQEFKTFVNPNIGRIVGVFDNKAKAELYINERADKTRKIYSLNCWEINKPLPIE